MGISMDLQKIPPDEKELRYIAAMSRQSVVDAYKAWGEVSHAERRCIEEAFYEGCRVLDLGCGAGRFASLLGDRAGAYLGVDASAEMIAAARDRNPQHSFMEGDINHFSADEQAWDLILLMGNVIDGLHPFSRRKTLLQQCRKWLKPDGKVIGSSHLTKNGQRSGYYEENYHGAVIEDYRGSLTDHISEVEAGGFEIMLCMRDYRCQPADWCYWLAKRV